MQSEDMKRIAKFTTDAIGTMKTGDFYLYMNALDWADTANHQKPASVLMHQYLEDSTSTAGYVALEFPKLHSERIDKDVIVSYDKKNVLGLSEEWKKPKQDHYAIGKMLGYPESAAKAFDDPAYNVAFDTFLDLSDGKKKFDEALFFAGHNWAHVDDEESLAMGRRRAEMFLEMFGQKAYDQYAGTYRQHLIDFNPILEDYIREFPGYERTNAWK
jgi:hypothetical protein